MKKLLLMVILLNTLSIDAKKTKKQYRDFGVIMGGAVGSVMGLFKNDAEVKDIVFWPSLVLCVACATSEYDEHKSAEYAMSLVLGYVPGFIVGRAGYNVFGALGLTK